jgi:hypothetical protein
MVGNDILTDHFASIVPSYLDGASAVERENADITIPEDYLGPAGDKLLPKQYHQSGC